MSDCETVAATATAAGIGVRKMEPFAVQAIGEIEGGIAEVQETLQIGDDADVVVVEDLILGLEFIVEIELVGKAGTSATHYTDAQKIFVSQFGTFLQFQDFLPCFLANKDHGNYYLSRGTGVPRQMT